MTPTSTYSTIRHSVPQAGVNPDGDADDDQMLDGVILPALNNVSLHQSQSDAQLAAQSLIAAKVADFFNIPVDQVNCNQSLPSHGVDSLVAVDFRNWLSSVLRAKVSMFDIMQSPSIGHLAGLVAGGEVAFERGRETRERGIVDGASVNIP